MTLLNHCSNSSPCRSIVLGALVVLIASNTKAQQGPVLIDPSASEANAAQVPKESQRLLHEEQATKQLKLDAAQSSDVDTGDAPSLDAATDAAPTLVPEELPAPRQDRRTIRDGRPSSRARDIARENSEFVDRSGGGSIVLESENSRMTGRNRELARFGIETEERVRDEVVVHEVYRGSPAERIGLRAGDTILAINGRDVFSAEDIVEILRVNSTRALNVEIARRVARRFPNSEPLRKDAGGNQTPYRTYSRTLTNVEPDGVRQDQRILERERDASLRERENRRFQENRELSRDELRPNVRPLLRGRIRGGLIDRIRGW